MRPWRVQKVSYDNEEEEEEEEEPNKEKQRDADAARQFDRLVQYNTNLKEAMKQLRDEKQRQKELSDLTEANRKAKDKRLLEVRLHALLKASHPVRHTLPFKPAASKPNIARAFLS